MPKLKSPKYRRQRRKNRPDSAFVVLNGERHYLGEYDAPESREKYYRLLAEFSAGGGELPIDPDHATVVELTDRFYQHAKKYYRHADGSPTSERDNFARIIAPLAELYGRSQVAEFGPRSLKTLRQWMIDRGWVRSNINREIGRVKHIFRWGVEQEIVPPGVVQALESVAPLKRGRCDAAESKRKRPVPNAHIEAVKPHVASPVWAMVQLQLLTGARAGELVTLRAIDFDTTGSVWTATITDHKMAYRDRERVIYFGPRAQAVVRPFMADRAVDASLFSPREAHAERKRIGAQSARRPGQKPSPTKTARAMADHYTTTSYRRAISRACNAAGIPTWSPHRLRHTSATLIRKEFGVEAAQVMLGHARADVTQIYAEVNHAKALGVAVKMG